MTAPEILYALITFMLGVLTGVYIAERHKDTEPAHDGVEGGSYTWPETTIDWPEIPTVTVGGEWGEIDRAANTGSARGDAGGDAAARLRLRRGGEPDRDGRGDAPRDARATMSDLELLVTFTDTDACEVAWDDKVLTLYRMNMGPGPGWQPVRLRTPQGESVPPECFMVSQDVLAAISDAEDALGAAAGA